MANMTNEDAISIMRVIVHMLEEKYDTDRVEEAIDVAIKAIGEIDHLIDRPCTACEYHRKRGCTKWECVFTRGIRGGAI